MFLVILRPLLFTRSWSSGHLSQRVDTAIAMGTLASPDRALASWLDFRPNPTAHQGPSKIVNPSHLRRAPSVAAAFGTGVQFPVWSGIGDEHGNRKRVGQHVLPETGTSRRSLQSAVFTTDYADWSKGQDREGSDCEAPQDFYQLLKLRRDASGEEIKTAYRTLTKNSHPDIAGQEANDLHILVTQAYKTLINPNLRSAYDTKIEAWASLCRGQEGYTGAPLSKWLRDDPGRGRGPNDQRAIFVDESRCVGCRMCVNAAPETFLIEDGLGNARVHTQWGNDEEKTQVAIESCPVDCIHYVKKQQLPVLEWCTATQEPRRFHRPSPFDLANFFIRSQAAQKNRPKLLASAEYEDWLFRMQHAWSKLRSKTKEAWAFQTANATL